MQRLVCFYQTIPAKLNNWAEGGVHLLMVERLVWEVKMNGVLLAVTLASSVS